MSRRLFSYGMSPCGITSCRMISYGMSSYMTIGEELSKPRGWKTQRGDPFMIRS